MVSRKNQGVAATSSTITTGNSTRINEIVTGAGMSKIEMQLCAFALRSSPPATATAPGRRLPYRSSHLAVTANFVERRAKVRCRVQHGSIATRFVLFAAPCGRCYLVATKNRADESIRPGTSR